MRVQFVYEGYRVKVKVTGAENVQKRLTLVSECFTTLSLTLFTQETL